MSRLGSRGFEVRFIIWSAVDGPMGGAAHRPSDDGRGAPHRTVDSRPDDKTENGSIVMVMMGSTVMSSTVIGSIVGSSRIGVDIISGGGEAAAARHRVAAPLRLPLRHSGVLLVIMCICLCGSHAHLHAHADTCLGISIPNNPEVNFPKVMS